MAENNEWTQAELEKVFKVIQDKCVTDMDFRNRMRADPNSVIREVSGKDVPEGFKLNVIENDPAYTMTFVLPDVVSEKMTDDELASVNSGVSVLLVLSACALALSIFACGADACAANACGGNAGCGAVACGGDVCGGNAVCGANACADNLCGGDMGVCGGKATGVSFCAGNMSGSCRGNACGADACVGNSGGPCPHNACGMQV